MWQARKKEHFKGHLHVRFQTCDFEILCDLTRKTFWFQKCCQLKFLCNKKLLKNGNVSKRKLMKSSDILKFCDLAIIVSLNNPILFSKLNYIFVIEHFNRRLYFTLTL